MDDSNNKYEKENVIIFMNTKYILSHHKNKVVQSKLRFFFKLYISKMINVCKYIYNIADNFLNEHGEWLALLFFVCSIFLFAVFLIITIIYVSQYDECGYTANVISCRNTISFWKITLDVFYKLVGPILWILTIIGFFGIAIFISVGIYCATRYIITKIYTYATAKYQEELPNIEIIV